MLNNQMKINYIIYTVKTLNNDPEAVNSASLSVRSSNDFLVLGGSTSKHCVNSNFYERNCVYEHIIYNPLEQAY